MCTVGIMAEESRRISLAEWAAIAVVIPNLVAAWFSAFPPSASSPTTHYATVMDLAPIVRVSFLTSLAGFFVAGGLSGFNILKRYLRTPLALVAPDTLKPPAFDWKPDWENLVYESSPGAWREAGSSERGGANTALVVKVTRQIPREGEGHADATIKAIVRITGRSGALVQVANPYWKGLTEYQAEFDVGHTRTVVIGCLEDSLLACYQNAHESAPYSSGWVAPKREVGTRSSLPASGTVMVELSLFDVYRKIVLKTISFDVIFNTNKAIGPLFYMAD